MPPIVRSSSFRSVLLQVSAVAAVALAPGLVALALQRLLPLWAALLLAVLGAPLGALCGLLLARRDLARARTLIDGSMELTRGKLGHRVDVSGDDELGKLGQILNYASQQLLAYEGENRRLYHLLETGMLETMVLLANLIDSKDSITQGHSQRVGDWCTEIGRELKMTDLEVRHLLFGGLLHDIGKVGIIEPILAKRAALDEEEMGAMRAHPMIGVSIISAVSFLKPVLPAVRNHHERWDGTGYPDKLAGEEIPLMARIVAVADTWDAMTSRRPYQEPLSSEQAMKLMDGLRGKAFDPAIVDALSCVVRRRRETGDRVSLADPEPPAAAALAAI